ncbi:DUF4365 domain-containing protein [Niallia circulans]|jgi:hypothetical protein|uniref:DUF4365 domain-containing protein n=1 Tax=Niallia TaxID=2837506 RepID=UPI000BA71A3C|nr:DUF4365 domain-containing protein [Niallia circulans]PAD24506.1 DUF4365 domain-containing protein [Niallia circulans]
MSKRVKKKQVTRKTNAVSTTIIEHLACLEINKLILQPPFHLISNIQWNDKSISFDGDIEVYQNQNIEKSNFINRVPVQVKGTTIQKTVILKDKISHQVNKKDLEVYYKDGKGVLYFVVTINPLTYARQAYYKLLAPLELKSLISQLNLNSNNSIALHFKLLKTGSLEELCKSFLDVVEKQPKHYIEMSSDREYTHYKIDFVDIKGDSFNLFDETAFIYGLTNENIQIPVKAATIDQINVFHQEAVNIDSTDIYFNYYITATNKNYIIKIEETLTFELDLQKKTGKLHLERLKTLGSYLKCLKLLRYYLEHDNLPFKIITIDIKLDNKDQFNNIDEEIDSYIELIEVCKQIGINEDYIFNKEENLPLLFNSIINIFKNENYESLKIQNGKLEDSNIININLSNYIRLKFWNVNNKLINFYSEEILTTIGGLVPKSDYQEKPTKNLSDNETWDDYYYHVSIYSSTPISDSIKDTNFDFEIVKKSFSEKYHDIQAGLTINTSLDFLEYYDISHDERFLELSFELNKRYLNKFPESDIAKINIFLVKLKKGQTLTKEEKHTILEIQESAEINKERNIIFACETLLGNKLKAEKIFSSLDKKSKDEMMQYPIYHFYQSLED